MNTNISIKKIDRMNKQIIVSKQFLINAGQFGTTEFKQYMELMEKHPGYEFIEYRISRNPEKQTYGKLTYSVMEAYIEGKAKDEAARKAMLEEYEAIKKISKTQKAAYAYVKSWFLEKHGEEFKERQKKREAEAFERKHEHLIYNPMH